MAMPITLSSKAFCLIVAFVLGSPCALALETRCPAKLNGAPLETVGLFNGNPSRGGELVPGDGGWTLRTAPSFPEGYFLLCHYKGTRRTRAVHIPAKARHCAFAVPNVSCR